MSDPLTIVEKYAVDMIVGGAESVVEDDFNEDGELSDADHEAAIALAYKVLAGMKTNPGAVLALAADEETG